MYRQLYFDKAPELIKKDNTGKQYIDIECHYSRKDCYGIGRLYDNNTVLLTEGIYDKCRPSFNNRLRQRYRLKLGLSVNEGEIQRNILCESPSMAACVITGNSSNGWSEWKDTKGREIIFYTDNIEYTESKNDSKYIEDADDIDSKDNGSQLKIIYCNIGWMKYYNGITDDDKITDGGAYINFNGHGGEVNNFANNNGKYLGYVRGSIKDRIDIQSHFIGVKTNDKNQKYIDNILVVWIAHRKIVGFYFNATVFEYLQTLSEKYANQREFNKANIISSRAILIPENDRKFVVNNLGQSNIWYGNEKVNNQVYQYAQEIIMKEELEKYIVSENEYGKPTNIDFFLRSELATEIVKIPTALNSKGLEKYINKQWLNIVQRSEDISDLCFDGGYDFYNYLSKQEIKTKDDLRNAIEQYKAPSIPVLSTALQSIFKRYSGSEIYKVPQADGTFKYLISTTDYRIVIYDEYGNRVSETTDTDMIDSLSRMTFKQVYLGLDINIFLNISTNNISDFELYTKCKSIEELKTISNQHNIIDNVAHANMSDTSMISSDSLESDKAEQAERSYESHNASTANIADELTDEATKKVVDTFTNVLLHGDENGTLQKLADETYKIQKEHEEKEQWIYKPVEYTHEYSTKDIYSEKVLDDAMNNLADHHVTAIIGHTGDGKTQLAYLLAYSLTKEPINSDDEGNHKHICVCNASQVGRIYKATGEEKPYILDRFIKYIKDNNIKEDCVFICNEIQRVDMASLLGGLFDRFTNNSQSFIKEVPNLYLIFTGCIDSDFGIDDQSVQRLHRVNIGYISKNNTDRHNKIIKEYANYTSIEKTLELVEKINDTEEYPVISMRLFKRLLNKENIANDVNEDTLSNDSKKAWDKLKVLYGINS